MSFIIGLIILGPKSTSLELMDPKHGQKNILIFLGLLQTQYNLREREGERLKTSFHCPLVRDFQISNLREVESDIRRETSKKNERVGEREIERYLQIKSDGDPMKL